MANFRDPITKKEYTVASHSFSFKDGKPTYKDGRGNYLVGEDGETPLELISKDVGEEGYRVNIVRNEGSIGDKYARVSNHFKKRASDHNKTDDVKEMKFKAVEREMGTEIAKTDLAVTEGTLKVK